MRSLVYWLVGGIVSMHVYGVESSVHESKRHLRSYEGIVRPIPAMQLFVDSDELWNFSVSNEGVVSAYEQFARPAIVDNIAKLRRSSRVDYQEIQPKAFEKPYVYSMCNAICLIADDFIKRPRKILLYNMRMQYTSAYFDTIDPIIWHYYRVSSNGDKLIGYSEKLQCPVVYDVAAPDRPVLLHEEKSSFVGPISCDDLSADESCSTIMVHDATQGVRFWRLRRNAWVQSFLALKAQRALLTHDGRYCVTLSRMYNDDTVVRVWGGASLNELITRTILPCDTSSGYRWSHDSWLAYDHSHWPHLVRMMRHRTPGAVAIETCDLATGCVKTIYEGAGDEIIFSQHSNNGQYVLLKRWTCCRKQPKQLRGEMISVFPSCKALIFQEQAAFEWSQINALLFLMKSGHVHKQ